MLTPKKKLYAKARLTGLNQTQSAIAAGYSSETARQSASRLEKDPEVIAHMDRLTKFGGIESVTPIRPKPPKAEEVKAIAPAELPKSANPPEPTEPATFAEIVKEQAKTPEKPEPQQDRPSGGASADLDPLEFMRQVVNDSLEDTKTRLEAAKAWAPYLHPKKGESGKKQGAQDAADKVAGQSKYAPGNKPRLASVK